MTEQDWLTCTHPEPMLWFLETTPAERRRFAIAVVRRHRVLERPNWTAFRDLVARHTAGAYDDAFVVEAKAVLEQSGLSSTFGFARMIVGAEVADFEWEGSLISEEGRDIFCNIVNATWTASRAAALAAWKAEAAKDPKWQAFSQKYEIALGRADVEESRAFRRQLEDALDGERKRSFRYEAWDEAWDKTWSTTWAQVWAESWGVPPELFNRFIEESYLGKLLEASVEAREVGWKFFDDETEYYLTDISRCWDRLRDDYDLWEKLHTWELAQQAQLLRDMFPCPNLKAD